VLLLGFVALMLAGVPVALAMIVASLAYVMISGTVPDFVVIHRMYGGIDSFPLLAVPFFILAGNLMNSAGITNRIYNFALALVGWLKGGLGHVNIVGSMIFAGMSGTAIADAAGLGTIEIKAMRDHGYPLDFSVGVTAASATLGPIIPPSLPFVIYGMMAGVSIGQLFLAGVIPGIVMGVFMMATVTWYAHRRNYGRDARFSWSELARTGADAFLAMMTPVILLGGMTFGVFTPTEGAIIASAYALVLGLAWYRTLDWRMLVKISMDTIETTATVLFIVAAASIFGWLLTVTRVTDAVAAWVLAFTHAPWVFLLHEIVNVGCAHLHHAAIAWPRWIDRAFGWFAITPRLHWSHHSPQPKRTNSNYGVILSIWDRAFGTLTPPAADPEFGLDALAAPSWHSAWGMLATPWRARSLPRL